MAKINLLPWRAERRKQRQKEFLTMLALSARGGRADHFLIYMYYDAQIDGQKARNQYLNEQITVVEAQIEEIDALDKKKANLLARKQVIEELQASRSQMVHLFDQLVRTIPEALRLNSIKQAGTGADAGRLGPVQRPGQFLHAQPGRVWLDGQSRPVDHRGQG